MIFGSILKKIPIKHGNELKYIQRIKSVNEGHEIIVPDFEILDVKNNEIHVKQDYIRGDTLKSYKCYDRWDIHELIFFDCVCGYDDFGITDYGWDNFILGVDEKLYYIDLGGFNPSYTRYRAMCFEEKYIDTEYKECRRGIYHFNKRSHYIRMESMREWCGKEYQKQS